MAIVRVELDPDLVDVLEQLQRDVKETARELTVLGLYRQGKLSSGKATQLLGWERGGFIRYASGQGIPYLQLTGEGLRLEIDPIQALREQ